MNIYGKFAIFLIIFLVVLILGFITVIIFVTEPVKVVERFIVSPTLIACENARYSIGFVAPNGKSEESVMIIQDCISVYKMPEAMTICKMQGSIFKDLYYIPCDKKENSK